MRELILESNFEILLRLLVAHLISDFVFQTKKGIENRNQYKYKSKSLYFHILWTGIIAYLLLGDFTNFWIPLFIIVTHYLIDLWKSYQTNNIKFFLIDQLLHFTVLILCWLSVSGLQWMDFKEALMMINNADTWSVVLGYISVIWPAAIVIQYATQKWHEDIENNGLENAGKWIGVIERILVFTFVLLGQYASIGLLIAAKSIFRYSASESKERKEAEYILIGTLLSFSLSIIIGIIVKYLIGI